MAELRALPMETEKLAELSAAITRAFPGLTDEILFMTVGGPHRYGFASPTDRYHLRGSHLISGERFWDLNEPSLTVNTAWGQANVGRFISHDLRKYVGLMHTRHGGLLESVASPLVVRTSGVHQSLAQLLPVMFNKWHFTYYLGYYQNQRSMYDTWDAKSIHRLLLAYRLLMTGCVLLRERVLETHLPTLNQRFGLPSVDELISVRQSGERTVVTDDQLYLDELERLKAELTLAHQKSTLPEGPMRCDELNRLLVDARRAGMGL